MARTLTCVTMIVFGIVIMSVSGPSTVAGYPAPAPPPAAPGLNPNFYQSSCPQLQSIVQSTVNTFINGQRSLAPALVRLFFHDCFVGGCDASVLIKLANGQAERDAIPNANSLRGFEVIDAIKAQLELPYECPKTVSCADVVALSALYATIAVGGPSWTFPLGRRDSNVSSAAQANAQIPSPFSNVTTLTANFAAKGLTQKQMVTLSGAHTIGSARCSLFSARLYNFSGTGQPDPTLDPDYAAELRTLCSPTDNVTRVAMKPDLVPYYNNGTFDSYYYNNLEDRRGLFISDATLITISATNSIVNTYAASYDYPFFQDFPAAMIAMGNINPLTGKNGAIHVNCSSPTG